MTASIATHGETLAPLMQRAGFRYVFLGIENILDDDLAFLKARAKNSRHRDGTRTNTAAAAIDFSIATACSSSEDSSSATPMTVASRSPRTSRSPKRYVDWPYIQHPTPYPGTPMTADFEQRNLIVNRHLDEYDGTTAVTRSAYLDSTEIEFMRWKAERWMKVRHMPAAFRHDPIFVLRNARKMLAHTFRG